MLAKAPEESLQQAVNAEVALLGPEMECEEEEDDEDSEDDDEEEDDEDMAKPTIMDT